jgi:hypothetical protein
VGAGTVLAPVSCVSSPRSIMGEKLLQCCLRLCMSVPGRPQLSSELSREQSVCCQQGHTGTSASTCSALMHLLEILHVHAIVQCSLCEARQCGA